MAALIHADNTDWPALACMAVPLKIKAEKFSMPADEVARIGIEGMLNGKAEIIPGFINWISAKLTGFVPKALTEKIAAGIYKDGLDHPKG